MKWRWVWLWALLPAGLGLLAAVLLNNTEVPNPILRLRVSVSSLFLLLGIASTLLLITTSALLEWTAGRRLRQTVDRIRREAFEDRRRFLQRLDHELKNPLTAMRAGLANFANATSSETRQAALATVGAQAVRLSRLTADLRKIAEMESRQLDRISVDIEGLLREVIELAQEKPEAKDRQLRLILPQAPWPLPVIPADSDLAFLAVYNLVDNALKFSQPGDTIEVRGREDGRFVSLEVADTGPGIREQELPHVWEELYRGDSGRTAPGSGLGLALVRAIAERHGGSVALSSKLGQGTVVTLQLPLEANTT